MSKSGIIRHPKHRLKWMSPVKSKPKVARETAIPQIPRLSNQELTLDKCPTPLPMQERDADGFYHLKRKGGD